jgi:drug/metabolite transporter (DMT)-like permease
VPEKSSSKGTVLLAFAIVYIVWGSTYLGIRYAIATIPPLLMAGTRFLLAGAILFAWSRWRREPLPKLIHWRTALILGTLLLLCGNGCVTLAEQRINSGLAALLVASEPLWLVLLAWAKPGGIAPTKTDAAGLALGFCGVALLVVPGANVAGAGDLFGAGLVLFAAFAWAAGSIYSTGAPAPRSPVLSNGLTMLAGGSLLTVAGLIHGEASQVNLNAFSAESIGAWLYLALFGSLVAFSAYTYLLSATTPARASTYAFVNPVVAVLLGWAVAHEPLTGRSFGAMALIVAGVVLLTVVRPHHANGRDELEVESIEQAA